MPKARLTPDHGKRPLCETCENATWVRGFAESQEIMECAQFGKVPFEVYDCSEYELRGTMTRYEMEQMAYIIERKFGRFIGFKKPKRDEDD